MAGAVFNNNGLHGSTADHGDVERRTENALNAKKPARPIDREFNTGLFHLRAVQLGLSIGDLEYLSIGMVYDMLVERQNDSYDYPVVATQADIDRL